MYIYPRNRTITVVSNVNPGEGETTTEYEWKLNGSIIAGSDTLPLNTNNMLVGDNVISFRARNSCGNWSDTINLNITVIEGDTLEKIVEIVIDKPVTNLTVVMDFVGTVNITVTDQLNRPVENATVAIDSNTGQTDINGMVSLTNVTYGTKTVRVTTV